MVIDSVQIANEMLKGFAEAGAKFLGREALEKLRASVGVSRKVADHIHRVSNRVSNCVTYRPSAQQLDDIYVQPLLLDHAMCLTYISPEPYAKFLLDLARTTEEDEERTALSKVAAQLDEEAKEGTPTIKHFDIKRLADEEIGVLVLGEAGAGKSSLISHVCLQRLRVFRCRLPIFVEAKDLTTDDVESAVKNALLLMELGDRDLRWMDKKIALYIDGLDELPPSRYKSVCAEIARLRQEAPLMQITAACRSSAYNGELSFLTEVTLLPFDRTRSESFIIKWFSGSRVGPTAEGLISQVQSNEQLGELAAHPLLLILMCNAYRRYLNVSRRQSALFDQCLSALLWQWDADRSVARPTEFRSLDVEKKKWLHSNLASCLHSQRLRFCNREFLIHILGDSLPRFGIEGNKAGEVLDELCKNMGILERFTHDTYGFGHFTLQEFLAGKWYADERRWQSLVKREFLTDRWWENVIAMSFASLSDASDAFNTVWALGGVSQLEKMRLLSHCLRFDPIVMPEVRNELLARVLDWYHNGDNELHNAAMYMLVGIDDDWTSPIIKASLASCLPNRELAKLLERTSGLKKEDIPKGFQSNDSPLDQYLIKLPESDAKRSS